MSDLTDMRDHARKRANWPNGAAGEVRAACRDRTAFGTLKPPDHANCGGDKCGCGCHEPTDRERALWLQMADEIDAYLAVPTAAEDLFGDATTEPNRPIAAAEVEAVRASRRARRSRERYSTCGVCKSRDVDGDHVDRCEERERYRRRAVESGAEYGIAEVTMNDLWAHLHRLTHNELTSALVAELVADLGWRPPVVGKPAPTAPPASPDPEPEGSSMEDRS